MKILCISASNNLKDGIKETSSFIICQRVIREAKKKIAQADCSILELKNYMPNPCTNCLMCLGSGRCAIDDAFNEIYEKILDCDVLFIVSPHYAPIPAKLCMIMEKMESITFNPWLKDNSYKPEVVGIPTGIISHGGTGEDWALREYEKVVNYPIANFLFTIPKSHAETRQLNLVAYDDWKTGISVPPVMNYKDWTDLQIAMFADYIDRVIQS
ncbi:MAG: NAD(P)H-dependent oxidoreductase [Defluviitaleaceae bacterium]|nr:NAD(P)H-dependent oxidoreductase [Defluviitaleaceae bacterium]